MDVCLIDVDSKIPNLALMRASTYHKQRGDNVKLGYEPLLDHPELCYASKIFDFTPEPLYMPDCETLKGGSGYSLTARMPFDDYDRIMPDYSLYGSDYAIGRFTRGCPNRCPWCVVPKMDGNTVTLTSFAVIANSYMTQMFTSFGKRWTFGSLPTRQRQRWQP